jgi:hypothetical protein
LYKACSFESGSENSFEWMWCIPNGFCIYCRRSFSEASWNIRYTNYKIRRPIWLIENNINTIKLIGAAYPLSEQL